MGMVTATAGVRAGAGEEGAVVVAAEAMEAEVVDTEEAAVAVTAVADAEELSAKVIKKGETAFLRLTSAEDMKSLDKCNGPDAVPLWRRYSFAAGCIVLAFLVRYLLTPMLGEELPFLLFIAAALVAAWYGGAVCGLAALALGLFLGDSIFLHRNIAPQSVIVVRFIRYIFTASLGVSLIEVLHRSKNRTEATLSKLKQEVERRKHSEDLLLQAEMKLQQHAQSLERRVEEQTAKLSKTVESLKNLLYFIAHNLRAPLRAMEGYASILMTDCATNLDPSTKSYSQHIAIAAKRMDLLIQGLLDYGRLGHTELSLERVSLEQVVGKALSSLKHEVEARCAEVQVISPMPTVRANQRVLEAVVINLLENAIKFVEPGTIPRVEIWSEVRDLHVRLWIKDNSPGIDPRFHERVFEAFDSLTCAGNYHDAGVGLAIVKQGVQRMGGRVGLESQPGTGSRFWVELSGATGPQQWHGEKPTPV